MREQFLGHPSTTLAKTAIALALPLAATLACAYLGMLEKLEPMQEMKASAYDLPYSLPRSLEESLSHLEQCEPILTSLAK